MGFYSALDLALATPIGILFFHEQMTLVQFVGMALILRAVILIGLEGKKGPASDQKEAVPSDKATFRDVFQLTKLLACGIISLVSYRP
ncbi:MAG: hypothetical protein PHT34_02650 [Oscillospiraceae bacterium]|nr:hypothetical protein [Oscillospiraceae bacterium]